MPQIGWFEILIVIVLAILIIGPKDFPIMLRKVGGWVSSIKKYFNEIQKDVTDIEKKIEDEISIDKDLTDIMEDKNKNE
tara:strand:+ start:4078 stop:4314 length:237 start_codon:yes stop_codon:yes gene_type:complete